MEYLIQPEDVAEALRWRAPEQRRKTRRNLLGWALWVAVSAALFVWLKSQGSSAPRRSPSPAAVPPPSDVLHNFVLPFIPWLLILAFVWFFVFRQLRGRPRKIWEGSAELQQPQVMEAGDQGVRIANLLAETLYRWNNFVGWAETPKLMLLLLPSQRRLVIPRRAAQSDAEWQQFRDLVKSHVSEPLGGFQVIPPKPVLPLGNSDATPP